MGWLCGRSLCGFGRLVGFALFYYAIIIAYIILYVNRVRKTFCNISKDFFKAVCNSSEPFYFVSIGHTLTTQRRRAWVFVALLGVRNGPGVAAALWGM